ncbi:hypothetical protein TNIN_383861 [Trichonephila inaurata madagascariensis]|uniref:Uncharacterized protein n=1 Tax=Trichonephila inaurata madagascariensis TaxID=2747483 RepID=A0A8X7CMH8_9ARAC|nr:hypothetical protein TNIN_383861 [Trichonephila inaurata madagascariensis]
MEPDTTTDDNGTPNKIECAICLQPCIQPVQLPNAKKRGFGGDSTSNDLSEAPVNVDDMDSDSLENSSDENCQK